MLTKKYGDWNCPSCKNLVFASKVQCGLCRTLKSGLSQESDWKCPKCSDLVFARRNGVCRCGFKQEPAQFKPERPQPERPNPQPERRPGDWWCNACESWVFSYKKECRCGKGKPTQPKDGECSVCLDAEATVASRRCGHKAMCRSCAETLDKCPICRKPYDPTIDVLRIY